MNRATIVGETIEFSTWIIFCEPPRSRGTSFLVPRLSGVRHPALERAVGGDPHARILDCGCGTGANVELLPVSDAPSVSISPPVGLCIGREPGLGWFGAVAAAPFPSAAFDLVTSFDVLYSLEEPDEKAAVAECSG